LEKKIFENNIQILDKPELLNLMLKDLHSAPDLYKPKIGWLNYEKLFVSELQKYGLYNFRRRKNSVLQSFGGSDIHPIDEVLRIFNNNPLTGLYPPQKSLFFKKILKSFLKLNSFRKLVEQLSNFHHGFTLKQNQLLIYKLAKYYGQARNAKPINELSVSMAGNPENFFQVNGNVYTTSFIHYYMQYAYSCKFINFDSIGSIMEIGSGLGKQVEIIKKLHPDITFFLFDLPPQLYICEQYLSTVFPESVVSYEETRKMINIPNNTKGKIFIFGPWQLPKLENLQYEIFWSSATLQEQEKPAVSNYLKFVNKQATKFVFLYEQMKRKKLPQNATENDYNKGLPDFELLDSSPAVTHARGSEFYIFSVRKRKNE